MSDLSKKITEYSNQMKEKYDIRCSSIEEQARNLSGGNQRNNNVNNVGEEVKLW
mgnify:CR=1 FL=1